MAIVHVFGSPLPIPVHPCSSEAHVVPSGCLVSLQNRRARKLQLMNVLPLPCHSVSRYKGAISVPPTWKMASTRIKRFVSICTNEEVRGISIAKVKEMM